jgi:ribose-phosphate pyrophosphokinase
MSLAGEGAIIPSGDESIAEIAPEDRVGLEWDQLTHKRFLLFSGRSHPELAAEIAACLGIEVGKAEIKTFANGEIYCRYLESVRGCDVFILEAHYEPINENIMEHLIMIDAARRASAKRITAVAPFFGYARQDKKGLGREPITARLIADLFTAAGADRILTVDLHTGQIQGFFDYPVDHLTARPLLASWFRGKVDKEITIVSPDAGRVKLAERWGDDFDAPIAIMHKKRERTTANVTQMLEVVGDVVGRACILVDDMIDTAGTITQAADLLKQRGAAEIYAAATHAVLSGPAIDRLKNAPIEKVVVTNTLPIPEEKRIDKIEVVSIAPVIARALKAVFEDTSVSEIFQGENEQM